MHIVISLSKSRLSVCIALFMSALSSNPVAAADLDTQKRVLALYEESSGHDVKPLILRSDAESELDNCARVHERYHWWEDVVEACTKAQRKVDECNAFRTDWARRRTAVLAEIDKQSPGIGQEYTEKVVSKGEFGTPMLDPKTGKPITETVDAYRLKGQISPLDSDQRWNDVVRGLRNLELRTCPGAVPGVIASDGGFGTPLSPAEALEYWKKQESKPLSRPTSSAAKSMLAAAVDQANDEGVIRDAEEEAAEKERQRLAKIKEEQDRLARIAAEKAAKEQARLAAQQEAEQEREDAEQAREDRAAAKQQAKTASTSGRSSGAGSSGKVSSASSVCVRNAIKMMADLSASGLSEAGDEWGTVSYPADIQMMYVKLFEPCAGSDPATKSVYDDRVQGHQLAQQACISSQRCTQWGTKNPQQNMAFYNWVKTQTDRALSDPNYSADQGRMRSGSGNESSTGHSGATSGEGSGVAGKCREGLARLDKEANAINSRRPANADTVPSIQVGLYIIGKRMEFMDSSCRGQPEYSEYDSLKKAYSQVMTTCQQVASSPDYCVAKVAW